MKGLSKETTCFLSPQKRWPYKAGSILCGANLDFECQFLLVPRMVEALAVVVEASTLGVHTYHHQVHGATLLWSKWPCPAKSRTSKKLPQSTKSMGSTKIVSKNTHRVFSFCRFCQHCFKLPQAGEGPKFGFMCICRFCIILLKVTIILTSMLSTILLWL